jgi:hypothetical protein
MVNSTIVPELNQAQSDVTGLLAQGGGLYLVQTSPTLQDQYNQFNANIQQAVQSITGFAQTFTQIANGLQTMDQQTAYQILHPSSS